MKQQNPIIFSHWPLATRVQPPVHIFNLSDALAEFRTQLERDAGEPLQNIETSAALVLDDLCVFLGFGPALRAKVLGQPAATFVEQFAATTILIEEVQ